MSCLVVGVSYRTDEQTLQFVRSLARYSQAKEALSVVLVDNTAREIDDPFCRSVHRENPFVQYVKPQANLGYFGGADYGLKRYAENFPLPEWVIICNVDLEFKDGNFFQILRKLEPLAGLGVVAPRIWSAQWEKDLNPKIVQRPARKRMLFYKIVFDNYYLQFVYESLSFIKNGLKGVFGHGEQTKIVGGKVISIYAPHGSCIIFNRRYFEAGGDLKYPVFLFGEEIFVAETVRRLGLWIGHCPQLWVLDKEHASTGIIRSRRVAGYMREATNYLLQNYFPEPGKMLRDS